MSKNRYMTAQEAAAALGISPATLYAYVSRGLIRSIESDESKRARRYDAEDVHKLKTRQEMRRSPEKAVEDSLHWGGAPVMDSALTLIDRGRIYYRGYDALWLAQHSSVESVAGLLWTGILADTPDLFAQSGTLPESCRRMLPFLQTLSLVERFQALLPLAVAEDLAAYDLRPAAVAQTGARIMRFLVQIAAPEAESLPIAQALSAAWGNGTVEAARLCSAALILCADHELNVSAFTARCVASAGATLYNAVSAGLAALQGVKHGGFTELASSFMNTISTLEAVHPTLAAQLKRGEKLPGFGHPLYPEGDPRAALLLDLTARAYPNLPAVHIALRVCEEAQSVLGEAPTIDFALALLARVWHLPPGGGLALFALGRAAGWIGHSIEQYALDRLIRPRARYIGLPPR